MDATQNSIWVVAFLTKNGEILEIQKMFVPSFHDDDVRERPNEGDASVYVSGPRKTWERLNEWELYSM